MPDQGFVARERELDRLQHFLDRALAGRGQICFVTGEAGAGKTTLVTEFARRAQAHHAALLVALGDCNATSGIGDPYLPFREVLGMLTGDVEAGLAHGAITQENAGRLRDFVRVSGQALVEYGPDLIDIFVPGGALMTRVAGRLARRTGWVDQLEGLVQHRAGTSPDEALEQSRIFEQYTDVLKALSSQRPLILVVDDLQWADAASISLLFHLSRRIQESRILLIGAYRPDDVALGRGEERHPLEPVLNELKRYFGDVWVDLSQPEEVEGRHFVDALLDSEPNRLGEAFRQALFQHTDGHPLFTIELLRAMRERGQLAQDEEGRWHEGPDLEWGALPARVEGVIGERVGRLEAELRQVLTVACVEGEDFTAEVVARIQAADERGLVRRLSGELQKQHRLVYAQGIRRLGPQRLSLYRFQHNVFQKYLYNGLDEVERAYLHEDVGNVLEELYGDQATEIAVQLAHHFLEAGRSDKAAVYLKEAGDRAKRLYANEEAIHHFGRALALLGGQESEEARLARFDILSQRHGLLTHIGRHAEAEADLQAMVDLGQQVDDPDLLANALNGLGSLYINTGRFSEAEEVLNKALDIKRRVGDPIGVADALTNLASYYLFPQLDLDQAEACNQEALALRRASRNRAGEMRSLWHIGLINHLKCRPYQSLQAHLEALAIAQEMGDRGQECSNLMDTGRGYFDLGDYVTGRQYIERALASSREIGDRANEAWSMAWLGAVELNLGQLDEARHTLEAALRILSELSRPLGQVSALYWLGLLWIEAGDWHQALAKFEQASGLAGRTNYAPQRIPHLVACSRIAAQEGQLDEARRLALEARDHMAQTRVLSEAPEIRHLVYQGLVASGLPATQTLEECYDWLMGCAGHIPDPSLRESFLHSRPANRAILDEWRKIRES